MSAPASRRSFLRGFTALSAGAVVLAAPAALASPPVPDAELIAHGVDLDRALAVYRAAADALAQAVTLFEATEPPIPEALRMRGFNGWVATDWPPDAFGTHNPGRVGNRIRIPCRHALDVQVDALDGRTILGRMARRTKKLSDAFHEAHEAAREAAGVPEAATARYLAGRDLTDLGFKVAAVPATSLAGLAVRGRAGLAMHRAWADDSSYVVEPSHRRLLLNLASLDGREVLAWL